MHQVFVSYVFEDKLSKDRIEAWAAAGQFGRVRIIAEARDLRAAGDAAVRAVLRPKLQGAAALLLLVGNDTHNHHWVDYEVDVMQSARKPVVVVRVPGTTGAAPFSARHFPVVDLRADAIREALRAALGG